MGIIGSPREARHTEKKNTTYIIYIYIHMIYMILLTCPLASSCIYLLIHEFISMFCLIAYLKNLIYRFILVASWWQPPTPEC